MRPQNICICISPPLYLCLVADIFVKGGKAPAPWIICRLPVNINISGTKPGMINWVGKQFKIIWQRSEVTTNTRYRVLKVQKKGGEEPPTTGQHSQVASQRFSFTLTRYLPGMKVEGKAWYMRTTTSRACNNDHRSPHAPQPGDPWPLSTSPTPPASKYNAFHWKGSCVAYKTPVLLFACYHITKINKLICPFMNIRSCLLGGGGPDRMMCRLLIRREAPSDQNCGSRW